MTLRGDREGQTQSTMEESWITRNSVKQGKKCEQVFLEITPCAVSSEVGFTADILFHHDQSLQNIERHHTEHRRTSQMLLPQTFLCYTHKVPHQVRIRPFSFRKPPQPCNTTRRIKKVISICQSLLCLDLGEFSVLSQIKPQAPLLVVPFRQFLSVSALRPYSPPEPHNFDFT